MVVGEDEKVDVLEGKEDEKVDERAGHVVNWKNVMHWPLGVR